MEVKHETLSLAQTKGYNPKKDSNVQNNVTQSNLQTWLREKKNIHINLYPYPHSTTNDWYYIVTDIKSKLICCESSIVFESFDKGLEAALNQSLIFI